MTARERTALVAVSGATALLLLDVTAVNVALAEVDRDLGASFDQLQWVVDAYALVLAAVLLTTGVLADRLGRRRVFLAGLAVFAAASLLCAAAPSATALDLSRAAQGLGAAAIFSTSLALLAAAFDGRARGIALGVWGAVSGAALALGPLAGGALVEGLGWRSVFWLNLPLCAALAWLTVRSIDESRDSAAPRPDVPGMALFTGAAGLLVCGLIRGEPDGWTDGRVLGALGGGVLLGAAFVAVERRHPAPMLDVRLFRDRSFAATAAVAFLQSVAVYPLLLFLTLFFQEVLGYGPLGAGARVLPLTIALFVVAPFAGRLTARVPLGRMLAAGLLAAAFALLLMRRIGPGDDEGPLLPGFLLLGAGFGVVSPALAAAMVSVLPVERAGLSTGVANTFRQLGIAAGIAGLGAIFHARADRGVLHGEAAAGYVAGLDAVFLVAAAVALAGAGAALLIRPSPAAGGAAASSS